MSGWDEKHINTKQKQEQQKKICITPRPAYTKPGSPINQSYPDLAFFFLFLKQSVSFIWLLKERSAAGSLSKERRPERLERESLRLKGYTLRKCGQHQREEPDLAFLLEIPQQPDLD